MVFLLTVSILIYGISSLFPCSYGIPISTNIPDDDETTIPASSTQFPISTTTPSVLRVLFPELTAPTVSPKFTNLVNKVDFEALCKQQTGINQAGKIADTIFSGLNPQSGNLFDNIRQQVAEVTAGGILCDIVSQINEPEKLVNDLLGGFLPLKMNDKKK